MTDLFGEPLYPHAEPPGGLPIAEFPGLETPLADYPVALAPYTVQPDPDVEIPRFRNQLYQGGEFLAGALWDLGGGADRLRQRSQELRLQFAIPLGGMDHVLAIRPYFRSEQLSGVTSTDLPGTLYDTGILLFNRNQWSERWSTTLLATPAVRSDFRTSRNAFRVLGLALVSWKKSPHWTWSAGVLYLDRSDLPVLPAAGFTWKPNSWWCVDATIPRPRISRRLWKEGGKAEGWCYLGGILGGNTYAVKRADKTTDEMTIRDLRVVLGYETIRPGNRGFSIEFGYAFSRQLEYEQQPAKVDFGDALLFQFAWQF